MLQGANRPVRADMRFGYVYVTVPAGTVPILRDSRFPDPRGADGVFS